MVMKSRIQINYYFSSFYLINLLEKNVNSKKNCRSGSVVEHVIGNDGVGGSIPPCGTRKKR